MEKKFQIQVNKEDIATAASGGEHNLDLQLPFNLYDAVTDKARRLRISPQQLVKIILREYLSV